MSSQEMEFFVPGSLVDLVIREGNVTFAGEAYTYCIINRQLVPDLPNFMGFLVTDFGYFLFISEDVPEEYHELCLGHELYEKLQLGGDRGQCIDALKWEIEQVPQDMMDSYLSWRHEFFARLIEYYMSGGGAKSENAAADVVGFRRSLNHLADLLRG